jgi:hypothetical protein
MDLDTQTNDTLRLLLSGGAGASAALEALERAAAAAPAAPLREPRRTFGRLADLLEAPSDHVRGRVARLAAALLDESHVRCAQAAGAEARLAARLTGAVRLAAARAQLSYAVVALHELISRSTPAAREAAVAGAAGALMSYLEAMPDGDFDNASPFALSGAGPAVGTHAAPAAMALACVLAAAPDPAAAAAAAAPRLGPLLACRLQRQQGIATRTGAAMAAHRALTAVVGTRHAAAGEALLNSPGLAAAVSQLDRRREPGHQLHDAPHVGDGARASCGLLPVLRAPRRAGARGAHVRGWLLGRRRRAAAVAGRLPVAGRAVGIRGRGLLPGRGRRQCALGRGARALRAGAGWRTRPARGRAGNSYVLPPASGQPCQCGCAGGFGWGGEVGLVGTAGGGFKLWEGDGRGRV